jgi:hypothetical protein
VVLCETNVLSLISQRLDNYYQIQTKFYNVTTVNFSNSNFKTKHFVARGLRGPRAGRESVRADDSRFPRSPPAVTCARSAVGSAPCAAACRCRLPPRARNRLGLVPTPDGAARGGPGAQQCTGVARPEASPTTLFPRPRPAADPLEGSSAFSPHRGIWTGRAGSRGRGSRGGGWQVGPGSLGKHVSPCAR